jgi:ribosomal protein L11 methyltransferase
MPRRKDLCFAGCPKGRLYPMPHLALSFPLGPRDAQSTESACFEAGALAVTLTDSQDDPVLEPAPGEIRLWPSTRVQALFDAGAHGQDAVITAVSSFLDLPLSDIEVTVLADRAWEREWLKDFHAMRFGRRLWVAPHHERVEDPAAVVGNLDPGLAFGTGTHATTALCLEWLDANLYRDASVIDYGCGSGILAIAAIKLGASNAACFDIDPQALTATRDNASASHVQQQLDVYESATDLPDQVDILLANILSAPLCALAQDFAARVKTGGSVVLAGLMEHEVSEVVDAYSPWFDLDRFGARDTWVCLAGSRRADLA